MQIQLKKEKKENPLPKTEIKKELTINLRKNNSKNLPFRQS